MVEEIIQKIELEIKKCKEKIALEINARNLGVVSKYEGKLIGLKESLSIVYKQKIAA